MQTITNALTRVVMARLNYWLGVMVDALLAGGFLVHAMRRMHGPWVTTGASLLAGLGLYGFLEYGVHRWAYHDDRSPATPGHRLHHDDPEDPDRGPLLRAGHGGPRRVGVCSDPCSGMRRPPS